MQLTPCGGRRVAEGVIDMSKALKVVLSVVGLLVLLAVVVGVGALFVFGRSTAFGYRGFTVSPMRMFLFPFGGGLFPILLGVLFIAGIVWLVAAIFRGPDRPQQMQPPSLPESPLDILKRRYAKGEINKEQYDQMKQDLGV